MLDFGGETLPCLRFVLLLFLGCMPYGIYSVPWMVTYTSRFLHVVPRMIYFLSYCKLLFLSLAGLMVCGFNQILQIYVCRLIGGDELLIV